MPGRRESPDTPRLATDDELTLREGQRAAASGAQAEPDSPRARVRTAINQMSGSGPDAELNYRVTLRELASDPRAAVAAVREMYRATPEDRYLDRWTQVHLLADLRNGAARPVLDQILSTPIPPEKAPGMITYSTVGEEAMIRTTAIEGLTRLAAQGDREALELLRKHMGHENFSVRRAAIQGYLEAAGEGARDELRRVLPERDQFILNIRRAQVQDVPQPSVVERPSEEVDQAPPAEMPLPPKIEE
jgi:HEAT repeat protein